MKDFYISRSALETFQNCPRKYYYNYVYNEGGVVPAQPNIHLTWGTIKHEVIYACLSKLKGDIAELPALKTLLAYGADEWNKASQEGWYKVDSQYWDELTEEHYYLLMAHVMWFYRTMLPQLNERFIIYGTEEEVAVPLGANLYLMSKPDGIIFDEEKGYAEVLSTKTCESASSWIVAKYQYALQQFTELLGATEYMRLKGMKQDINYTAFLMIAKGEKQRQYEWAGMGEGRRMVSWTTNSPLIYGYAYPVGGTTQFAHSLYYEKEENKSGVGRLGKGWEKFKVWEDRELGPTENKALLAWQKLMQAGETQGLPKVLDEIQVLFCDQEGIADELLAEMKHYITRAATFCQTYQQNSDKDFYERRPQRCFDYNTKCEYFDPCWKDSMKQLVQIEDFVPRKPHYKLEKR